MKHHQAAQDLFIQARGSFHSEATTLNGTCHGTEYTVHGTQKPSYQDDYQ